MEQFARLLEGLLYTPSRNRKIGLLIEYFSGAPDPDRGLALAALTGEATIPGYRGAAIRRLMAERVDETLFAISYDYVGDLAETVALMWPDTLISDHPVPSLGTVFAKLQKGSPDERDALIAGWLSTLDPTGRWALLKLITGGLRVGVSARLAKQALAQMGDLDLEAIERVWHGVQPPYEAVFHWVEGKADAPEIRAEEIFHPMMLASPVDEEKDFQKLDPRDFAAEWKWDGIRVQLSLNPGGKRLYSRTGDDISHAFPDLLDEATGNAVLDGELLVGEGFDPLPFNCLQQRLNRKKPVKKHLKEYPAFMFVYDILFLDGEDLRDLSYDQRRSRLSQFLGHSPQTVLALSDQISYAYWTELGDIRAHGAESLGREGVMLKRRLSPYVAGRPKGEWFKWKRNPRLVDAILMYAQRGHGKRSSFYSDFTFGVPDGNQIVPIGKAYSGFTDEELKKLDRFVRANTTAKFGPVREVAKTLVVEVAFDAAQNSPRHKSGIALRFPRFSRIRWDKPVDEVETLEAIKDQFLD